MSKYLNATRTVAGHAVNTLAVHEYRVSDRIYECIGGYIQDPRFPRRLIGRWDLQTGVELDMGSISDEYNLILE